MAHKHNTIKDLISSLCQIFDPDASREICPETFRLGKFNDGKAEASLRFLLAELLVFLRTKVYNTKTHELVRKFKDDEIRAFIEQELERLAGPVCSPNSSRLLLLAVGWLISEKNVLEELILTRSVKLGEDIGSLSIVKDRDRTKFDNLSSTDPIAQLNSLQWFYGSILSKLRMLNSMSSQRAKLLHKIHRATKGAGFGRDRTHLSMLEVYMLRHPDVMKTLVGQLEEDNLSLENLVLFKNNEHIFWKWMDSVVGSHENGRTESPNRDLNTKLIKSKEKRTELAHQRLQTLISRREDAIDCLDQWIEREESWLDSRNKEAAHSEVEGRIANDISSSSAGPGRFLHVHYSTLLSFHQTFASPPRDKNKNYIGQTLPEKVDPLEMYENVDDLIPKIEKTIQDLEAEISDIRCQYYDLMT